MELDGRPVTPAELAGLALYNYGHFTSMLVDRGRTRGLQLHLERLRHDAVALFGRAACDDQVMRGLILRATPDGERAVVRVTVFAPDLELGRPSADLTPHVLVTTRPAPMAAAGLGPLDLVSTVYEREQASVKHVGLFGTVSARRHAQLDGHGDVVFVSRSGLVLEGATWNVGFCAPTGEVIWPEGAQLAGVTMRLLVGQLGGDSRREPVPLTVLRREHSDWAGFITNAVVGVRPIAAIDGIEMAANAESMENLRAIYADLSWDEI